MHLLFNKAAAFLLLWAVGTRLMELRCIQATKIFHTPSSSSSEAYDVIPNAPIRVLTGPLCVICSDDCSQKLPKNGSALWWSRCAFKDIYHPLKGIGHNLRPRAVYNYQQGIPLLPIALH